MKPGLSPHALAGQSPPRKIWMRVSARRAAEYRLARKTGRLASRAVGLAEVVADLVTAGDESALA
jgi:hypothetical protein